MAQHWTTKELHEQGLTTRQIAARVQEGTLYRLCRGIYTATRPDPESALRALQHRYPRVIFCGVTAAALYGFGEITAPAQGRLPHRSRPVNSGALHAIPSRQRRSRRLRGVNVATPVSAVAAMGGHHDFWGIVRFLETSYSGLRAAKKFESDFRELSPQQRQELKPVLERCVIGASSRMERLFISDLRKAGLDPIPNFPLGPYHWDIGFRRGTTVVDLDSRRFHAPDDAGHRYREFIVDRWKTNHAVQSGWAGLRYTDDCLRETRAEALHQITRTVAYRQTQKGRRWTPAPVPDMHDVGIWKFHPELFD